MSTLLTVQVTEEEGGVTLYCPELDLVTCGSTLGKARENFADLVEEYYLYLIDNEGQLDAESRAHLNLYRAQTLNYHYDREEDILYVTLGDSDSALCIEQGEGFLVRIDPESDEVVGFTVIDFSLRAAERVAVPVYAEFALPQDNMLVGVEA